MTENEIIEYARCRVEKEKKEDDKRPHIKITWDNHSESPQVPRIRVVWDNENPGKVKIEIDGEEKDMSEIRKE